jgi:hypothetical protein
MIFEVTDEQVERLNDSDLRMLVAYLCAQAFVCNAFHRLKDSMEVVVGHKLITAEPQFVGMDTTTSSVTRK